MVNVISFLAELPYCSKCLSLRYRLIPFMDIVTEIFQCFSNCVKDSFDAMFIFFFFAIDIQNSHFLQMIFESTISNNDKGEYSNIGFSR